ncbi:hypothetical protein [Acinetobacter sp. ANC 4173]|jgi:hypothetical protein|uniref:hypothetical protein n=1 Tax=Acinetobacter sp. ANC 4173 TaxID=2529837 RepID=UPI00103A186F|nr:hypothetical protein [Acinetobacter sp. ANC 4173]TCB77938.1 hypothetical protein E0H94_13860 [Acinetobacter sp. ANC 4173]
MIKATLLLVLSTGLMMGCMSHSPGMDHSSPMLQQTDYQPEPSHQKYMNDNNGSSPKVDFTRYPLIDL